MHGSRGPHGEHRRPGAPLLIALPDVLVGLARRLGGTVVQDTGPGIPPDVLPRVLDPFFTTKSEGTGLGLSISYGIVRDHEGTVDVETGEGRGTRFVLTFPAAPEGRQA